MIQIYEKDTIKPEKNGVMTLFPERCKVQAALNGGWSLTMEHPLDDEERWKYIEEESIVSVPTFMGAGQLFRIDKIEKDDYGVSAIGYPIFYDSAKEVFLMDTRPADKNGQEALDLMLNGSKYSGKSDITAVSTAYFERRNMLDALNGTDSPTFLERWGGEVLYDNYTVIVNKQVGGQYGVEVRYGKNMSGLTYTVDMSNVMTRIVPVAYNGRMISGSTPWVDSSNINKYATVYIKEVKFEDVKLLSDLENADDAEENDIICKSQTELETALKNKCKEEYQNGADLPAVTLEVDMVQLSRTNEYSDVQMLEQVSLGDTVRCRHKKLDITTEARVIEMEWDCIKNTVSSVKLGDFTQTYFDKVSSAVDAINSVVNAQSKTVMAEKIKGVLNAINTQLRYQKNVAQNQDVRAILFEDTDTESSTYGAMCLGTQGFQIADKRTADGKDWDWATAFTAKGGYANTLILGILSDQLGKNYWNLDTGDFVSEKGSIGGWVINSECIYKNVQVGDKQYVARITSPIQNNPAGTYIISCQERTKENGVWGNWNPNFILFGDGHATFGKNLKFSKDGAVLVYDDNNNLKTSIDKTGIKHYEDKSGVPYHYRTYKEQIVIKQSSFSGGDDKYCYAGGSIYISKSDLNLTEMIPAKFISVASNVVDVVSDSTTRIRSLANLGVSAAVKSVDSGGVTIGYSVKCTFVHVSVKQGSSATTYNGTYYPPSSMKIEVNLTY